MLSCSCYHDDDSWYYYTPNDFTIFTHNRRKQCCSCKKLIDFTTKCLEFDRKRYPRSDIEERIYGDEVSLASWFMCENCAEIFLTLAELGYCHYLGGNIQDDLKDYWGMTGFIPAAEEVGCGKDEQNA